MPIPFAFLGAATFTLCSNAPRINCVVDGDTFWLRGEKIRIADINAPETRQSSCPAEQALGRRATVRLMALLNAGPFELAVQCRKSDRYGRALRVVKRGGQSLGAQLINEGLAEPWRGRRSDWCTALAVGRHPG